MFDGKQYGEEIVGLVRGYVERELAPLKSENDQLKARLAKLEVEPEPIVPPEIDKAEIQTLIDKAVDQLKAAPDPSPELQAALAGHFLRKELGDTTSEMPPLPEPEPQVNVQVDVHVPKKGVEETVVTERDDKGRVAKFERREVN
jgi:hypothetical protein